MCHTKNQYQANIIFNLIHDPIIPDPYPEGMV